MNIVRFYNQNRKKIWKAIIIIASFIILLQVLNYLTKQKNQKLIENISNSNTISNTTNSSVSNLKATSNTSGVSGGKVPNEKLEKTQDLLDDFFEYCNNNELEKAYDMLTDECKELIYPSLELFKSNYYNNIFNGNKKIYSFENWNNNTYIVTVEDDILSTGKISSDTEKKIDYVTIVNNKLNISTYIGRTKINKETINNDIKVLIDSKDTFMDYETYNISVTNNSGKTICLADIKDSKNIYIKDQNENKYDVYNHELLQENLIIQNNYKVNLKLKFYSSYVSKKNIKYLVFDNLFTDYENDRNNIYTFYANV